MSVAVLALASLGAVAGLGSGWLAVVLETREKLREEEEEDRLAERAEHEEFSLEAAKGGLPAPPEPEPWVYERYGWTWLEWGLGPALGALMFGLFASAPGHLRDHRLLAIQLLWVTILVHIVPFDLKHRLILNHITFPAIALALLLAPLTPGLGIVPALSGAALLFVFFWLPPRFWKGSIGGGDAKLGAFMGAVTGLSASHLDALLALVAASLLGGLATIPLLVLRGVGATFAARRPGQVPGLFAKGVWRARKEGIPYGPFLCAGAALLLYKPDWLGAG